SSGATTKGQLNRSEPSASNPVLKRTHTSAGKTFTWRVAGTAKLFSASTNVSTAAWVNDVRASGRSRERSNDQQVKAISLSIWAASSLCHAPKTANRVMGQSSRLRTQTAPPREIMLNGSHRRQTPVWPRRSSQQFVTRNGGRASDRI